MQPPGRTGRWYPYAHCYLFSTFCFPSRVRKIRVIKVVPSERWQWGPCTVFEWEGLPWTFQNVNWVRVFLFLV